MDDATIYFSRTTRHVDKAGALAPQSSLTMTVFMKRDWVSASLSRILHLTSPRETPPISPELLDDPHGQVQSRILLTLFEN